MNDSSTIATVADTKEERREATWYADPVEGRPEEDVRVGHDAPFGDQFYAATPADAELAVQVLNAMQDKLDAANAKLAAAVQFLRESFKSDRANAWLAEYDASMREPQ